MTTIDGSCATHTPTQFEQEGIDSDVNPNVESHVEAVEDSYMERIADLERQIANSDDPQRELELQDEIMNLENAFDDFKDDVESLSRSEDNSGFFGFVRDTAASAANAVMADDLQEVVSDFRQEISASYAEYGTAEVPAGVEESKPAWEPVAVNADGLEARASQEEIGDLTLTVERLGSVESGEADASSQSSGTESSEGTSGSEQTSDSGDSGSSEGVGATEVDGRSVEEMTNMMSNDPDAFMAEMQDMDSDDRNDMMILIQQQLQEMNQMFQMMTQFQQVMHDTQTAAIQNMRV